MVKQKKKYKFTCYPTMGPVVLRVKQRYPDLWPAHLVVCINRQAWEITAHKSCAWLAWGVPVNLALLCPFSCWLSVLPTFMGKCCLSFIYSQLLLFPFHRVAKLSQREYGLGWDGASLWVVSVNDGLRKNPVSFLLHWAAVLYCTLSPLSRSRTIQSDAFILHISWLIKCASCLQLCMHYTHINNTLWHDQPRQPNSVPWDVP